MQISANLENREERIVLLYKFYLLNLVWKDEYFFNSELHESQRRTFNIILENREEIEKEIIKNLKIGWKWERINPLEKAILLNAVSEIKLFGQKKKIIVSESNKIINSLIGEDKISKYISAIINKIA